MDGRVVGFDIKTNGKFEGSLTIQKYATKRITPDLPMDRILRVSNPPGMAWRFLREHRHLKGVMQDPARDTDHETTCRIVGQNQKKRSPFQ